MLSLSPFQFLAFPFSICRSRTGLVQLTAFAVCLQVYWGGDEARKRTSEGQFTTLVRITVVEKNGGQGRNRTADAGLFRAALYQLSYLANGD